MNPDTANILQQTLRDLHLPPPIGWWPPAPGWWIIAIATITLTTVLLWQGLLRVHRDDPRRYAIAQLDACYVQWQASGHTQHYLRQCNDILRRLAIGLAGRTEVARLSGARWVDWLDTCVTSPMSPEARFAIAEGCYRHAAVVAVDSLHSEFVRLASSCHPVSGDSLPDA